MQNLDGELAYYIRKLGQVHADDMSRGRALPPGVIAEAVRKGPFELTTEEQDSLIRELEQS